MARRREPQEAALDRVLELLDEAPAGLHDLVPRVDTLPDGLPAALIELYARCDGGRLFIDSIELRASADVERDGDRWIFGTLEDADLSVDDRGRVWRLDASLDDLVCEGTALDRWLAGMVDALALLYDDEGEFADEVFDEDGELLDIVAEKQLRAILKRDPRAPAPRWRLAHALLGAEAVPEARRQLEELVANEPGFAWGWLDLAKISELTGELANAIEEARAGAEAAVGHPQAGYFWSQVARLAARAGDEPTRATAAANAQRIAPELKPAQLAGVRESIAEGDAASARGLLELLRAVWPRDLEVLDLVRQLAN